MNLVLLFCLPLLAATPAPRPRLAVLPLTLDGTAKDRVPAIADELLLTVVHQTKRYEAIGPSDANAALSHMKTADLLGCDDPRCFVDVAAALRVDQLLATRVALVNDEWLVTGKLLELEPLRVVARSARFVPGDFKHLVAELPAVIGELFAPPAPAAVVTASPGYQCQLGRLEECKEQCALGHPGSCYTLAFAYEKGVGTATDDARAAQVYERLCTQGHAGACSGLGLLVNQGRGGLTKDPRRAAALHQKSCDGGHPRGCYNLGAYYRGGLGGLPRDLGRTIPLYQRACDATDRYCGGLGTLYHDGEGVPRDFARAAALLTRACDAGGVGCTMLGIMRLRGEGGAVDLAAAATLFARACALGFADGCHDLARAHTLGEGVGKDQAKATALFEQACAGGYQDSCVGLAKRYWRGIGVPAAREKGKNLARGLCSKGNSKGCAALRELEQWEADEHLE